MVQISNRRHRKESIGSFTANDMDFAQDVDLVIL